MPERRESVEQRLTVRERVLEFLAKYGEKGYLVLKAAVEASLESSRGVKLGDFSYREVVAKLKQMGLSYNPSNLLTILEKEYYVIETTYHSSNQHWWRFLDITAVLEALDMYERGIDVSDITTLVEGEEGDEGVDHHLEVLRAQIAALNPRELLITLRKLALKPRLTPADRKLFARIAFNELELVAKLLDKALEYEDVLKDEIKMLKDIIRLASLVSRRIMVVTQQQVKESEQQRPLLIKAHSLASSGGDEVKA